MDEKKYQVRKLFENIYTFEEGERVRCFLVIGEEKAVMIDTGNGLVQFEEELPALTDKPVFVINTHGDGDHTAGNDHFDVRYIAQADMEILRSRRPELSGEYQFVKEGDIFDLGNTVLRVIETPGHTPGSIVLYDEENKIMYGGDTLTSYNTFMFSANTNHMQMVKTFKRLMDMNLEVDILLTCHDGCPITNYAELLRDSCAALESYLNGEPETEVYLLKKGSRPRYVKRYIHGCATIIPEVVANAD